jgi:aldehyde dehydrogenase (NAD+)
VAKVAKGTVADVDRAVQAARDAFDNTDWKNMNPKDRAKVLYAISYQIAAGAAIARRLYTNKACPHFNVVRT